MALVTPLQLVKLELLGMQLNKEEQTKLNVDELVNSGSRRDDARLPIVKTVVVYGSNHKGPAHSASRDRNQSRSTRLLL